jgi:hypothetical protein
MAAAVRQQVGCLGWALGLPPARWGASKIQATFIRVCFHGSFASGGLVVGVADRAGRIDMCAAVLWMLLGSHGVTAVEEITDHRRR